MAVEKNIDPTFDMITPLDYGPPFNVSVYIWLSFLSMWNEGKLLVIGNC